MVEDRFKLIIDTDNNNRISYRGNNVSGVCSYLFSNENLLLTVYQLLKEFPELQVDDVKIRNNNFYNKIGFNASPVVKKGITRLVCNNTIDNNADDVEELANFFHVNITEVTLKDDNDNHLTIKDIGEVIDDGLFVGISEQNTHLTLSKFLNVVNRIWGRKL